MHLYLSYRFLSVVNHFSAFREHFHAVRQNTNNCFETNGGVEKEFALQDIITKAKNKQTTKTNEQTNRNYNNNNNETITATRFNFSDAITILNLKQQKQ